MKIKFANLTIQSMDDNDNVSEAKEAQSVALYLSCIMLSMISPMNDNASETKETQSVTSSSPVEHDNKQSVTSPTVNNIKDDNKQSTVNNIKDDNKQSTVSNMKHNNKQSDNWSMENNVSGYDLEAKLKEVNKKLVIRDFKPSTTLDKYVKLGKPLMKTRVNCPDDDNLNNFIDSVPALVNKHINEQNIGIESCDPENNKFLLHYGDGRKVVVKKENENYSYLNFKLSQSSQDIKIKSNSLKYMGINQDRVIKYIDKQKTILERKDNEFYSLSLLGDKISTTLELLVNDKYNAHNICSSFVPHEGYQFPEFNILSGNDEYKAFLSQEKDTKYKVLIEYGTHLICVREDNSVEFKLNVLSEDLQVKFDQKINKYMENHPEISDNVYKLKRPYRLSEVDGDYKLFLDENSKQELFIENNNKLIDKTNGVEYKLVLDEMEEDQLINKENDHDNIVKVKDIANKIERGEKKYTMEQVICEQRIDFDDKEKTLSDKVNQLKQYHYFVPMDQQGNVSTDYIYPVPMDQQDNVSPDYKKKLENLQSSIKQDIDEDIINSSQAPLKILLLLISYFADPMRAVNNEYHTNPHKIIDKTLKLPIIPNSDDEEVNEFIDNLVDFCSQVEGAEHNCYDPEIKCSKTTTCTYFTKYHGMYNLTKLFTQKKDDIGCDYSNIKEYIRLIESIKYQILEPLYLYIYEQRSNIHMEKIDGFFDYLIHKRKEEMLDMFNMKMLLNEISHVLGIGQKHTEQCTHIRDNIDLKILFREERWTKLIDLLKKIDSLENTTYYDQYAQMQSKYEIFINYSSRLHDKKDYLYDFMKKFRKHTLQDLCNYMKNKMEDVLKDYIELTKSNT